jgi:K+-sensing histidine kinase KdpD
MFIDACSKFAYERGLREVRVAKASALVSFTNPYGRALIELYQKAVPRIRRDMELIYDKNASELGLVPDGNWFKWQNASSIRDYQPTILRHATPAAASVALMAATTAILFQMHDSQAAPQGLVYFYLIPLVWIAILSTARIAILSAGMALLSADYFLQDPIYSFYTSEYYDLILFLALAGLGIKALQKLIPRSRDRALMV